MKPEELAEFRTLLLQWRARLRGDVVQMTSEALERNDTTGESHAPTHLADLSSESFDTDFQLRRVEDEQETLDEVEAALGRLDLGTYGQCERCIEHGKPAAKAIIAKARLKVIPYARNCIDCERALETGAGRR